MRKILLLSLGMVITLGVLPTVVLAQEEPVEPEFEQVETTQADETTSNGQGAEKREERLQSYKDRLAEKLSSVEERSLRGKCKGAQQVVLRLTENVAQVKSVRENAYNSVTEKLTRLVTKLETAGVDASTLSSSVSAMDAEVDIFLATLNDYQIVLTDLSEMDCESDPEAFKAALTVAKQQRVTLISSSQGLRQYFNDNIKPTLQQLRQELTSDGEGES